MTSLSPSPRHGVAVLLALAWLAAFAPEARAQVSAAESERKLKPAEGLEATLWAAEPMVVNPTNMDVDSRGRVWVAEGLNYRLTRGGNKRFPRVENDDKIKILEDTDGDGKADKMTVFADKIFPVPMGIAVEEFYDKAGKYKGCRVFVGNSPDLLVLEDTDGDDKADKRYPLLTGFGGVDSDHGVHGMTLGPDGKLYFTHGDGCCSVQSDRSERKENFDVVDKSGRRVKSDQLANTLRVNRDGTEFEVVCDRQRNNYETSVNAFGDVFTSDNDDDGNRGCRVIWAMDGGHYGYQTPGSPRHWGEDVPGNVPKIVGTGNGSPTGIMVYEGRLLPDAYFGGLLEVDAGSRQVNFFPITRKGASFRTDYKVFLTSDDPWFRPVDATTAPDGSVFVADWYDAGVGGHAFSDQTTGRIYRVVPKGAKPNAAKADFGTIAGLIEALKSPNTATHDAARRGLIAWGTEASQALLSLIHLGTPEEAARAIWTASAMPNSPVVGTIATEVVKHPDAFHDGDPRLRVLAVRILGRDCRENGTVEYKNPEAKKPAPALANLDLLLTLVDDPDPAVRRELILAFRNLPTPKVADALRKLVASWDGQDRWYLEALGLALDGREAEYITSLMDPGLFGESGDFSKDGRNDHVALPPYFPVDRNEAFIAVGAPDQPTTGLSKFLGLLWRLHRPEALPVLEQILPNLKAPGLQQAGDDILRQLASPAAADVVAHVADRTEDPVRRRGLLAMLAEGLAGPWKEAKDRPPVTRVIAKALDTPDLRSQGVALAAATGDARYQAGIEAIALAENQPVELVVAAVEALGVFRSTPNPVLGQVIADVRNKPSSTPRAEAAVRTLPKLYDARDQLLTMVTDRAYPLGLRREALRTVARLKDGGLKLLDLVREKKLPDDLKTEATTVLHSQTDRRVRDLADELLPQPLSASGRPLPSLFELIRRDGDAGRGETVFFRAASNACGACHRVQGRGQWIGPDLSTIGTKYGKEELLKSILNPSAAIGYNFRSMVVGLADGRVVTGLPVDETPERLVLKTAEGERVTIRPGDIEDRRASDVSLMPENLAQTMTDGDLVDLVVYLGTLKQPVSIIGQYQVVGPIVEPTAAHAIDPTSRVDLDAEVSDGEGRKLSWRRINANAEGIVDLSPLLTPGSRQVAYGVVPIVSSAAQKARLVLDTPADVAVWHNGKPTTLTRPQGGGPFSAEIELPEGPSALVIRVTAGKTGSAAPLVTTIVAPRTVDFSAGASGLSAR
ncbi:PVC-type heme-binding CxxCH protein [Paludisphaera borealis]|uniref:Cytochrome c domain-containing protein n=1 Tax=Paludisphaera borealis TaxID=1387353 RepID=A0A1U7CQ77_9BACT|nr:PVC-type heme-binding CxxCH protein [Paludisphaera borealis]APW61056.1 putative beta-propeller-type glycoside hydrolase of unknown function [Paludisphaera borealis]